MPIIELQRRLREAGRIRIGEKVATSNGKSRPAKIDRFRFTSADKASMDAIAEAYGGEVGVWEGASVGVQWELYAETTSLDVIVPPVDLAFSQFLELWKGGGCERRCDGQTNLMTDKPCLCDAEAPECKPTTRLGVILTAVQGIGMWRLETHGWNAASELNGAIEILRVVQNGGRMIPARLMLEQRQSKKDGKTYNYAVPVLDLNLSVAALTGAHHHELPTGATPIDATRSALPSVAEQVAATTTPAAAKPRRANAAATLPPTGLKPPARGAEPISVDEVNDEQPPVAKSSGALRGLYAIKDRTGTPVVPKDDDERHKWATDALGHSVTSFTDLTDEEIGLLKKHAKEQAINSTAPAVVQDEGYGESSEPF